MKKIIITFVLIIFIEVFILNYQKSYSADKESEVSSPMGRILSGEHKLKKLDKEGNYIRLFNSGDGIILFRWNRPDDNSNQTIDQISCIYAGAVRFEEIDTYGDTEPTIKFRWVPRNDTKDFQKSFQGCIRYVVIKGKPEQLQLN